MVMDVYGHGCIRSRMSEPVEIILTFIFIIVILLCDGCSDDYYGRILALPSLS